MAVIAIDGPAAGGKGTAARRLAAHLGYAHLDTGKLFRATARDLLAAGGSPDDPVAAVKAARRLGRATVSAAARPGPVLSDPALADPAIAAAASRLAALAPVRTALLDVQRRFARHPPGRTAGAVLDGRDIGTVVCPDADLKFFLTASPAVRARRRHKELLALGHAAIYAEVLRDTEERDRRDRQRTVAPLLPAPDAIMVDTATGDADRVFAILLEHVQAAGLPGR